MSDDRAQVPDTPVGRLRLRWLWRAVLVVGAAAYLWLRVLTPLGARPFVDVWAGAPNPATAHPFAPGFHGNDFKHIYLGAWLLDHGQNPYDADTLRRAAAARGFASINPYVYLPFTGIVMAPLARLDPVEALRTWFVLNHLFLLAGLALAWWSLGMRVTWRDAAIWACVAAMFAPLSRTLTAGQLNCALFFLFALVYALYRRGWAVAAGAVAAFAFLYKLAPGILLAWFGWEALRECVAAMRGGDARAAGVGRRLAGSLPVRAGVAMVVATGLLLGISVARVGWQTHLAFRPLLEQMGYGRSTWSEFGMHFYRDPENQSFNSLLHHLFVASPEPPAEGGTTAWADLGTGWANGLTRGAFLACVALVLWRTLPRRSGARVAGDLSYGSFVLLGLLAPSIYWDHYAVIALWPLLAVYARLDARVRVGAFVVAFGAWAALSAFREMGALVGPAGVIGCVAMAVGVGAWLVATRRGAGLAGAAWGVATALFGARYWFGAPGLRQGVGLLGMPIGLWGTLVLLGLCLRRVKCEE